MVPIKGETAQRLSGAGSAADADAMRYESI